MAVDSPVLERTTERSSRVAVPSRVDFLAEEEHNAHIKDAYARLINPEYKKVDDVFSYREEAVAVEETSEPVQARPYLVENARATATIFRADSAVNGAQVADDVMVIENIADVVAYEEDEDLRPTETTIQYKTLGKSNVNSKITSSTGRKFEFGKKEKVLLAVFVTIIVALLTLVIVNSAVIANLNSEIIEAESSITTLRGAIAGVDSTAHELIMTGLNR